MTELERYKAANTVLLLALSGLLDSEEARDIAANLIAGKAIDWDNYCESTKQALHSIIKE